MKSRAASARRASARSRLRSYCVKFFPIGSALLLTIGLGSAGLFADILDVKSRIILVGVCVFFGVGSLWAQRVNAKDVESDRADIDRLTVELRNARSALDSIDPGRTLDAIAQALFRGASAWRLTIYAIERMDSGEPVLRRLVRKSGSELYEKSGRLEIPLGQSFLREIPSVNLSNPLLPYVNQSGIFPDRSVESTGWNEQQALIVGGITVSSALTMPTRKYAWCAARDHASGRTVALMAESLDPDGINVEVMRTTLLSPWLATQSSLVDLPLLLGGPVDSAIQSLHQRPAST